MTQENAAGRRGVPSLSVSDKDKADVVGTGRHRRLPSSSSSPSASNLPWLIYCHGKSKKKMYGAINNTQSSSSSCFGELCGKDVVATFPGWLLLLDNSSGVRCCYSLWNTSAGISINLPPLNLIKKNSKGKNIVYHYALLPSGSGRGGLVLVFDSTSPIIFCCRFTAPVVKEEEEDVADHHRLLCWTQIKYDKQMEYVNKHSGLTSIAIEPLLTCRGRLYGSPQHTGRLLVIDIVEHPAGRTSNKPYDVTITPSLFYQSIIPNRSFRVKASVVECEGELFLVQFVLVGVNFSEVLSVHVSKINFSDDAVTLEEVGVSSMRDKCFFLDAGYERSGFGISNVPHGQGNRIYFLEQDSKYLYCFNMEDNSCSVSLPCPYLPTPWWTPVWVWPQSPAGDKLRVDDNTQDHKLPDNDDNEEEGNENMFENDIDVKHWEDEEVLSNVSMNVTHLFGFHGDVIKFITDKLMPTDYLNFRASSTRCRLVSPPKHWRTVLADVDDTTCTSAWLMFPSFDNIWNFLVPNHQCRYLITSPASLEHATIRSSKDGWLLLSTSRSQEGMVFFNPFTKALIELPNLPNDNLVENGPWVGFTFLSSPVSAELLVVGVSWFTVSSQRLAVFRGGYDKWRILNYENNRSLSVNYNNPVFWEGRFYFLGEDGTLGTLTESKDDWEWEVLDVPRPLCGSFRHNFLVECGGELMSVFVGFMGSQVGVFKLNPIKRVWQKVKSLGNHVLYVSRSSSFSMLARTQGMENRIYFPRVYNDSIVFYSLDTAKFYSEDCGDRPLKDYCDSKELLLCGWIQPSWRR